MNCEPCTVTPLQQGLQTRSLDRDYTGSIEATRLRGNAATTPVWVSFRVPFWVPFCSLFGDLLELILGLLGPPGAHFGPPRALPSTRSTKLSQTPFEITVQKVFSEPLKARCAIPYRLSGRLWGACAQLDPATEPFRLNMGPWSEAN